MAHSPLTVRATLLQVLLAAEGCGSALRRRVDEATAGRIRIMDGVVYPALWDLEAEGLVTCRQEFRAGKRGPPVRVYALTEAGRERGTTEREAILALLGGGQG